MQRGRHRKIGTKGWKVPVIVVVILGAILGMVFSRPRAKGVPMADVVVSGAVRAAQSRTFSKAIPRRVSLYVRPVVKHTAPPEPAPAPTQPAPAPTQPSAPVQPWGPATPPQQIAESMLPTYGWDSSQMGCLVPLWNQESGWNVYATNPSSGAYGIPQALPADKMASAGSDWQTNPATQIRWGLGYIQST